MSKSGGYDIRDVLNRDIEDKEVVQLGNVRSNVRNTRTGDFQLPGIQKNKRAYLLKRLSYDILAKDYDRDSGTALCVFFIIKSALEK